MSGIVPVILCGGSGTRLWPRSRKQRPKPFLRLVGEEPLFRATLSRCGGDGFGDPVIVTGSQQLALVEQQLAPGLAAQVIVEPVARNTAAAIALAACRLPDHAIMLVCPSDHHIGDPAAFAAAAAKATVLARQGWLVAFGIVPTGPETGFGYIKAGAAIDDDARVIDRFVEKPDSAMATRFLAEGGYSWNGGIFGFSAGRYMVELERFRPDIAEACRVAVAGGRQDGARFYPDAGIFTDIDGESVDYAVMERTDRAAVVPARMQWSDIGNWPAILAASDRDGAGNAVRGRAELIDCRNVLVDSDGPRVSVVGLENVVVVVDGDEVLVTSHEGAQKIGKLKGASEQ